MLLRVPFLSLSLSLSLSSLLFLLLSLPSLLSLLPLSQFRQRRSTRCIVGDFQPFLAYTLYPPVCASPLFLHLFFLLLTIAAATVLVRVSLSPRCAAHTRPCTTHTSKRDLSPAGSALPAVCVLAGLHRRVHRRRGYRGFPKSPWTSPRLRRSGNAPGRQAQKLTGRLLKSLAERANLVR